MDIGRDIAAPPAAVWELLAGTRHWPRWGPTIASVEPRDVEVREGLNGRVHVPFGLPLPFTVLDVDPGRRWTWKVAGVHATGHRVEDAAIGCRAVIELPWWAAAYAPVCVLALARLARLVEERPVS